MEGITRCLSCGEQIPLDKAYRAVFPAIGDGLMIQSRQPYCADCIEFFVSGKMHAEATTEKV